MIFEKQVVNGYKGMMHTRYDNTDISFYFSYKDFEGLEREAYAFKSSMGHTLRGYLYYHDQFKEDRLIVFDHGLGNGHRAYMKEIELMREEVEKERQREAVQFLLDEVLCFPEWLFGSSFSSQIFPLRKTPLGTTEQEPAMLLKNQPYRILRKCGFWINFFISL